MSQSQYASGTDVSTDRSRVEIEKTLLRYGADDIICGTSARSGQAFIQFYFQGLPIRLRLPLPQADAFRETAAGKERKESAARAAWAQACRQQWRVLLLMVKANLEAVANGIMSAEEVFLPWLVLPGTGNRTVFDTVQPELAEALKSGQMKALPFGGPK